MFVLVGVTLPRLPRSLAWLLRGALVSRGVHVVSLPASSSLSSWSRLGLTEPRWSTTISRDTSMNVGRRLLFAFRCFVAR